MPPPLHPGEGSTHKPPPFAPWRGKHPWTPPLLTFTPPDTQGEGDSIHTPPNTPYPSIDTRGGSVPYTSNPPFFSPK